MKFCVSQAQFCRGCKSYEWGTDPIAFYAEGWRPFFPGEMQQLFGLLRRLFEAKMDRIMRHRVG
jgi:hypothetical protein